MDVLQQISDTDIATLRRLYEKRQDVPPFICSTLDAYARWRRLYGEDTMAVLYVPDTWRQDGTFVLFSEYYCRDIVLFSLDDEHKTLYKVLMETNRFNYSSVKLFFGLHYKHFHIVKKVVEDRKLNIRFNIITEMMVLNREEALDYTIECPDEVRIDKLKVSDAEIIDSEWPHHYPGSKHFLEILLERNGGYGLYLKSNGDLVAWIIKNPLGQPGMLQVLPEHKRKGYGALITKVLSKELAREGYTIFATVVEANIPSIHMFNKLGFHDIGKCYFMAVEEKSNS